MPRAKARPRPGIHLHPVTETYHVNVYRPDGRRRKLNLQTADPDLATKLLEQQVAPALDDRNVLPDDFRLRADDGRKQKPKPSKYLTGRRWMVRVRDHLGARMTVHLGMAGDDQNVTALYSRLCQALDAANRLPPGFELRDGPGFTGRLLVADVFHAFRQSTRFVSYSPKERQRFESVIADTLPILGQIPVENLSPPHIVHMRDGVWGARGLGVETITANTRKLKTIFSKGAEVGWCPPEVWSRIRAARNKPSPEVSAAAPRPRLTPTDAEVDAILHELPEAFHLAAFIQSRNGLRIGEVASLSHETVRRDGDEWLFDPKHHKTSHRGHSRPVSLTPGTITLLRRIALRCQGTEPWVTTGTETSRHRGEAITDQGLNRELAKACRRAGVQRYTTHALRRFALSRAQVRAGKPAAQLLGGHHSETVTRLYTESADREARRNLASLMD